MERETLELDTGEFGCVLVELGESGAEVLVLEPTVQCAAVHLGEASGLRYGGGCAEYGKDFSLPVGEVGVFLV